jgi:hypothetical protein
LKVTDDEVVRKGLESVAETIITGKVGYDDLTNSTDEDEDDY